MMVMLQVLLVVDPNYSDTEHKSGNYLKSSINNHYWYGGLSTINYQANRRNFTFWGIRYAIL